MVALAGAYAAVGQTTITYANPAVLQETAVSSTAGSSTITVSNGANYAVGDVINFYGTTSTTNPFGTTSTLYYITSVSGNNITVSTTPGGTALNATNTTTASTTRLGQGTLTGANWTGGTAPNSSSTIANFNNTAGSIPAYVVNGGNQTVYGLSFAGNGSSDISLVSGANGTGYNVLNFVTSDSTTPKITLGNSTTRLIALGSGTGGLKLAVGGTQGLILNSLGNTISSGSGLTAVTAAAPAKEIRLQNVDWSNFSGGITVERGEVRVNAATGQLPNQSLTIGNAQTLTNNQLAVLNLGAFGSTVDGLNGNNLGRIYGGSTLTVGNANGSGDFGGIIGQNFTGGTTATNLSKVGTGTQTISGAIKGTGTVAVSNGTLVISGTNTSSGATNVTGGALRANDGTGLSSTSALTLNGGVLESIGVVTFNRAMGTTAGTLQWGTNGGGFSANGGKMTVNIGGSAAELVYGTTAGTNLQGTLKFGSATANAETEMVNGIDLAGSTRTVDVAAGTGGDSATLSGNIRSTSGTNIGLTKTGAGTLLLKGSNTYDGTTTVSGGTLEVGGGAAISDTGAVSLANTAGVTFKLNSNETIGSLAGGGTTGGNVNLQTNTLTTGGSNAATSFSGVISGTGALVKTGSNTFTLGNTSNSFNGGITIANGTLIGTGSLGNNPFSTNAIQLGDSSNNNVTLQLNSWNNLTTSNTVSVVGSGSHTIVGSHNNTGQTHILGGAITLNSNDLTIRNTLAAGFRIQGGVTGSGNLNFENNNTGGTGLNIDIRSTLNNTGSVTNSGTGNYNLFVNSANGGSIGANVTSIIQNSATSAFDLNAAINSGTSASVEVRAGSMLLNNANSLRVANTVAVGSGATLDVRQSNTIAGLTNYSGSGGSVTNNSTSDRTLTVGGSGNYAFSGVISDGSTNKLGLTKSGSGTQTLSGANTYSGATLISGGTLALGSSGSIDNTSGVSLGTGGTFDVSAKSGGYSVSNLSGSGDVLGALTVTTDLAIGNSPGTVNFDSDLTLGSSSTYSFELLGGTTGLNSADLADVAGDLTILSGAALDLIQLATYTANDKFTLFAYSGALTGTFSGLADGAEFTDAGGLWKINYYDTSAGTNGGSGASYVTITAVPEPSAALIGSFGMLFLLRRRR